MSSWYKSAHIQPACPADSTLAIRLVYLHWVTQTPNHLKSKQQTSAFNRTLGLLSLSSNHKLLQTVESLLTPYSLPWLPAYSTKIYTYFLKTMCPTYMTMGSLEYPSCPLVHWWVNSYSAKTQYMHIRSPQPLKCSSVSIGQLLQH